MHLALLFINDLSFCKNKKNAHNFQAKVQTIMIHKSFVSFTKFTNKNKNKDKHALHEHEHSI